VEEPNSNRVDLHLKGAATLIRLPMLASELEGLKPNTHVHIHIDDLDYIDHACIDLLTNWDRQHKASGGSLEIEWEGLTQKYQNRSGLRARAEATGR
jgi:ABC-type transporter Mla MlaB component